ncbi:Fpg/Nei family DNA glycosylase [Egicoccus sp. AB-alg6-2]|uniref:Fpg/Nei family DNA glycosylase n=1 Tax=Egicoccus sp. AB-alg6-2 TaxID=3242692 RepID=UPI00359E7680
MPEGDTIHRAAAALRPVLVGRALTRVELPRLRPPLPRPGATVTRVEARGKHLLVHTDEGLVVHTHLRMTGSWHVYRPGERWQKSPRSARVVLGVAGATAVCFAAPVVEVLDQQGLARHPTLRRLGPDLCEPRADLDDVLARLDRQDPGRPIGEVLLDQSVACGIGNVYRCDVAFLHGLDPHLPLAAVPVEVRRAVYDTAARLLRRNLESSSRTTVTGAPVGTLWVYGRGGAPCRRCGSAIRAGHLGEQQRLVYWCPRCQPADGSGHVDARGTEVAATPERRDRPGPHG